MSQFSPTIASFIPSAADITRAQERRRLRRMFRDLAKGCWRRVLMDMKKTQHLFPSVLKNDGTFGEMLVKFNVFNVALKWHGVVAVGNPVKINVDGDNPDQIKAITQIRQRCLFDARMAQAIRLVNREAEAFFCIHNTDRGVVLALEDNERTFAIGPDGVDGQPAAIDRRWIIERADPANQRKKRYYLRIERHTAGRIEHIAYQTESSDLLQDESKLVRVPLARAVGTELAASMQEVVETGLEHPAIVRLVADEEDGDPAFIVNEHDIDLFDALAAAFSRLARTAEQHGDPKMRAAPEHVNPKTGQFTENRVLFDPEKEVEYIQADFKLEQLLEIMDSILDMALMQLQVSKSLVGLKAGAAAESYEAKVLDSTATLARAKATATYVEPALGRLFTDASHIESRRPDRGFAVSVVTVEMRPEIPKSTKELVSELGDMVERRLTSHRRALAVIHGDDQAEQVRAEIIEEEEQAATREARKFAGAFGPSMNTGNPKADDAATGALAGGVA